VVSPAENFVGDFLALADITDNYLFSFSDHDAIDSAGIVCCAGAAPAKRFHLKGVDSICEFDEAS
jgi:hypothetical protein